MQCIKPLNLYSITFGFRNIGDFYLTLRADKGTIPSSYYE
jgi:hypothetical protein